MIKIKQALISGLVATLGLTMGQIASAESRWSVGTGPGLSATARLDVEIRVPQIIILKVGDLGSNVNEIVWDATGTTPNDAVYNGNIPPTIADLPFVVTDDETTTADGSITVRVFGNGGDVTISGTGADPASGGLTLPLSDITAVASGATTHPTAWGAAGTVSITATNNIVNPGDDTWVYTYVPTVMPAAGTYTSTITYTATNP